MSQPSPALIFEAMTAHIKTSAMHGAVELDVFTAIDEGAFDAPSLAVRCQTSEKGMRILCDYLTINGFLSKIAGKYALTADSAAFLSKRSPMYMGGVTRFLGRPGFLHMFDNIAEAVRKGGCVDEVGTVADNWDGWVDFAHGMAAMMMPAGHAIAGLVGQGSPLRVLDLAAGHGMFGVLIAQSNPHAQVVALDWHDVLTVAKANAAKAGVSNRYATISGSAFEAEFGSGYDVVLITNFFHHFDEKTCVGLMRKVWNALKPGGRAVTLEFVPNEDRVTPPSIAEFAMTMLGSTPAGDAYTFAEYERMFFKAGFDRNVQHVIPSGQSILVSTK